MTLVRNPPWRFVIAGLDLATRTFLDHRATNRRVEYALRKATQIQGRVSADDREINADGGDGEPVLAEGVRLLICLRREGGTPPWVARAAGLLLQANRSVQGDATYVDFTAWDPRMYLYSRPVRKADGGLLGQQGLIFKQQRGNVILRALLNRTVTADGPIYIDLTSGVDEDTDPIDINFQQGSSVGEAIDALEATGSIDVLLPTIYDPVGSPGNIAELNMYVRAGAVQTSAVMAFDQPGRSIAGIDWLEDGTQRADTVELYTTNGLPTVPYHNLTSEAKYGSYWLQQRFPVQAAIGAIEAEAAAQSLIRGGHPTTLRISPVPEYAPVPLTHYGIADWFPAYASSRLGKQLEGRYRVYELPLEIADDSVESVVGMLISGDLSDNPAVPVGGGDLTGTDGGDGGVGGGCGDGGGVGGGGSPGSGAIDDMRATGMVSLSSTGQAVDAAGNAVTPNVVQSQDPAGFWTALLYTNDDVQLAADARFTQVYRIRTNGQSHNPWWSSPTTCNSDLNHQRPLSVGQVDWTAFSVMYEAGWDWATKVWWHVVNQQGYPVITSPALGIGCAYGPNINAVRAAGLVTLRGDGSWQAAEYSNWTIESYDRVVGKWLDVLTGIKWGSHNDGEINIQTRCLDAGDTGWVTRVNVTGLNTWQWGRGVAQDAAGVVVNDKDDSYLGYRPGITDATAPENFIRHTGHVRCANEADAKSYFP